MKLGVEITDESGSVGNAEFDLDEFLSFIVQPDILEEMEDDELSEVLVSLHQTANKLLMEAQRRGILQGVMDLAMTLDGAPKGD